LRRSSVFNPTAFHNSKVLDVAAGLVKNCIFIPEFLEAILFCYGLHAVRKFVTAMVPRWMDSISGQGFEFISMVAEYSSYFQPQLQLELQDILISRCEQRRFDVKFFEPTTIVMLCSSPVVSPLLGRFLDCVSRFVNPQLILNMLAPLLEPRSQPIMHPLRGLMPVREVEKRETFT
jgi:hypothetical protein